MAPSKLSEDDKLAIFDLYRQSEETTSTLAKRYGVSVSTISRLLKSKLSTQEYEELVRQKRLTSSRNVISEESGSQQVFVSDREDWSAIEDDQDSKSLDDDYLTLEPEQCSLEAIAHRALLDNSLEEPQEHKISSAFKATDEASATADNHLVEEPRRRRRRSSASNPEIVLPQFDRWESGVDDPEEKLDLWENNVDISEAEMRDETLSALDRDEIALVDESEEDYLISFEEDDFEDDEEDDFEDDEEDDLALLSSQSVSNRVLKVLPLSRANLPRTAYVVIDRMAELVTCPLMEFRDLGTVPVEESSSTTLPVFDNHRVARRFSKRNQRVIKVPDTGILRKTASRLEAKGITRLLLDGQVYALNG